MRGRWASRIAPQAAASAFKWIVLTNAALFSLPALERLLRRRKKVPPAAIAIGWVGALGGTAL